MTRSKGFPPLARKDARILILGSLPGQISLAKQQYYAHPRNVLWRILNAVFAINGDYNRRCEALSRNGLAMWDVLKASVRPGSLDADIQMDSATVNDFESFLNQHSMIELILFNGKKAEALFCQRVPPALVSTLKLHGLPSTSPAYAAMPYAAKLEKWQAALTN
jgi:TDG/mug DNA glycosylase family protein